MTTVTNIIDRFFKEKLSALDQFIYLLILLNLFAGIMLLAINQLTYHYVGMFYFTGSWQRSFLPLLLLSGMVIYFREIVPPRVSLTIFTFSTYALILCVGLILTQGIEVTPFPTIDHYLLMFDHALGFHQVALLQLVYPHEWLTNLLSWGYNSLVPEMIALPLFMALLLQHRSVYVFLIAILMSYFLGTLIFYFFPTTAPASVLHSILFTFQEHDTYIKFYEIHHHLKITTDEGGLVAFPSFHVIWAILLIYLTRFERWIFFPLLLWNMILISSTLALGWHYLADVMGGILLAGLSIRLAEYAYAYLMTRKLGRPCGGVPPAAPSDASSGPK